MARAPSPGLAAKRYYKTDASTSTGADTETADVQSAVRIALGRNRAAREWGKFRQRRDYSRFGRFVRSLQFWRRGPRTYT